MTELATTIIEDGQAVRAVYNYLSETFDGIKGVELFDRTFTDRIEFIEFIQDFVCPMMITSMTAWKQDEPEEYKKLNQI